MNKVNELIAEYINEEKIPGAITLIARANKVIHFECTGSMNIEENLPMQEDTIFRKLFILAGVGLFQPLLIISILAKCY